MTFKRKRAVVAVVLVLVAGAAVFALVEKSGDAPKLDDKLIVDVKRGDLAIEVVDTAKIQPKEKVSIKSKIAGVVTEVLVDEGARVTKGQLLLRLDPIEAQRDVALAEADVLQAQSAVELAASSLTRKRKSFDERGVSQSDLDVSASDLKMKEAQKKSADTALAAARDRLRYTEIRSPLAGTVIERGIQPGEVVTPGVQATFEGKALLVVADVSTLIARAELNQIDVARLALGQRATLTLDALPGRTFDATVTKIAPSAVKALDREVEVFPVEVTLAGPAPPSPPHPENVDGSDKGAASTSSVDPMPAVRLDDVKPGMTADLRVRVETVPNVLLLPIEAVRKEGREEKEEKEGRGEAEKEKGADKGKEKKTIAMKVVEKDGRRTTEKVEVTLGKQNDRQTEIASGLAEGDKVLIDPASSKENEADI
jgi:HlyD family secretion protein/macrolide-specific efflux system membrane fusion protein